MRNAQSRASVRGCVAHLTLVVQGREVRKFVLNPTVTTIGRSQDNDIVINNLALSRRHAELHFRSGRFEVEDLGSQNGVFVNNSRIRGPEVLTHEDTVTLGTYHFVFSDEEAQSRAAARSPRRKRRAQEVTQLEAPEDIAAAGDLADDPEIIPLLVLKYNDVELQRFPVMGDEVVVGRAKECDIQIAERRLSRRHCKITREGQDCVLSDLGSQNGSYVNRRRIPSRYVLKHGDLLNFAEYTILFLADATEYDGPDRDPSSPPNPRPTSGIEREETEFPEAYAEDFGYNEQPELQPSIIPRTAPPSYDPDSDPEVMVSRGRGRAVEDPSEPFVERPVRARERQTQKKREIQETRRREPEVEEPRASRRKERDRDRERRAPAAEEPRRRVRKAAPEPEPRTPPKNVRVVAPEPRRKPADSPSPRRKKKPARRVEHEHRDVDDHDLEPRPDSNLDDWYQAREDSEIYQEEPSVLLERSKSSMSQILSTMMVDKRDVDRNLKMEAKARKFEVKVTASRELIYEGPLENDVTILGTDAEADILLKGRYVAGRHSLLVQVRDSLLLVRLGSSSAARVNGLPKLQAFLKKGDVVQIDETTIEITNAG